MKRLPAVFILIPTLAGCAPKGHTVLVVGSNDSSSAYSFLSCGDVKVTADGNGKYTVTIPHAREDDANANGKAMAAWPAGGITYAGVSKVVVFDDDAGCK